MRYAQFIALSNWCDFQTTGSPDLTILAIPGQCEHIRHSFASLAFSIQLEQKISGKLQECVKTLLELRHKIEQSLQIPVTESETTSYKSCYQLELPHFTAIHGRNVR